MEKIKTPEKNLDLNKIADALDALQNIENGGRGVECVRTVAFYLHLGDLSSAKAVCWNEADKIVSYPKRIVRRGPRSGSAAAFSEGFLEKIQQGQRLILSHI